MAPFERPTRSRSLVAVEATVQSVVVAEAAVAAAEAAAVVVVVGVAVAAAVAAVEAMGLWRIPMRVPVWVVPAWVVPLWVVPARVVPLWVVPARVARPTNCAPSWWWQGVCPC